jgi:hypothetical protein
LEEVCFFVFFSLDDTKSNIGIISAVKFNKIYFVLYFYYYYLVCEAIGTAATPGLLCQPRVIMKMIVEKQMECRSAGETEVLGEKTCPSATFVYHKIPHDQTRV